MPGGGDRRCCAGAVGLRGQLDTHRAALRLGRRGIVRQGKFGLIDEPELIDLRKFKHKTVSLYWELMFTRSLFSTVNKSFGRIDVENLRGLHVRSNRGGRGGRLRWRVSEF